MQWKQVGFAHKAIDGYTISKVVEKQKLQLKNGSKNFHTYIFTYFS